MQITATRRLEWDSAHRVLRHESKCRTLHGHRYAAEVTVEGPLDSVDRVIDFGVVKEKLGAWIDEHLDHATIVGADDLDLAGWCFADAAKRGTKAPYALEGEPTAENIAKLLFGKAIVLLDSVRVIRVRVYETPNCYAEATS